MNLTESFRDKELVKILLQKIHSETINPVRLMEVCGGHTMAIRKYGINSLLPESIELLSGPGCPICVTDQTYIDSIIAYACQKDKIIVTYGDMIRVPGSSSSLDREKAAGADIRTIYSTSEALEFARENPSKKIIFAAIGFETTAPATAIAVLLAEKEKINNFSVLCAHKVMPQAMSALIEDGIPINGYIGPGHVCAIAGSKIFIPLSKKHKLPITVSGFEPVDILESILILVRMINEKKYGVDVQYRRLVSNAGNLKAQKIVETVFEPATHRWRGIGPIENSGLKLKNRFSKYDAQILFPIDVPEGFEPKNCLCGLILKGIKKPADCTLFGKICTPSSPVGACMVSPEGACNANFNYNDVN